MLKVLLGQFTTTFRNVFRLDWYGDTYVNIPMLSQYSVPV